MARRFVDLSMPIQQHWRFPTAFEEVLTPRPQFVFHSTNFTMGTHGFTHVDAPFHTDRAAKTIDQVGLTDCCGPATLIDVSDLGDESEITASIIRERGDAIRPGDILLIRSDQEIRHPTTTKEFWTKAPWVSLGAAKYILELGVKAVAFDFPQDRSIRAAYDPKYVPNQDPDEDEACHVVLLSNGVLQFEYLCNFAAVRQRRFQFFGFPLRITGGDGSPVRALALEEDNDD